MRKDTIATRNKIIATAERLFAERGVDAVSLNEITREADQKNKSALSYHFGGKEGLMQAIVDKHTPDVLKSRDRYLKDFENRQVLNLENIARSVVYALASKLDDDNGGRQYLSILAQLAASNQLQHYKLRRDLTEESSSDDRVMTLINDITKEMPEPLRHSRILQATSMLLHSLSYLSQVIDKQPGTISMKGDEHLRQVFVDNLVDSLVAIANVTPSATTQLALAEVG